MSPRERAKDLTADRRPLSRPPIRLRSIPGAHAPGIILMLTPVSQALAQVELICGSWLFSLLTDVSKAKTSSLVYTPVTYEWTIWFELREAMEIVPVF